MNEEPIITPSSLIKALLKEEVADLRLKKRAIIFPERTLFSDTIRLLGARENSFFSPIRKIFDVPETQTHLLLSFPSGPNIAISLEELNAFGVKETVLIGLCGSILDNLRPGDILVCEGGISDEGTSKHYIQNESKFLSNWFSSWKEISEKEGFFRGYVWTTDALYRETKEKLKRFRDLGAVAVDMEVATFYAVSNFLNLKAIAFLLVSDKLSLSCWTPGFHAPSFMAGKGRLLRFILNYCVL